MSLYDVNGNLISGTDSGYYSTEDKKKFPQYYGIDLDNGKMESGWTPENSQYEQRRVPPGDMSKFPKENLSVIVPKLDSSNQCYIKISGDTTVQYNPTASEVYVNDIPYVIYRWDFSELPSNPIYWQMLLGMHSSRGHSNATTWIVQDMPLEEITAEFIANECIVESVTETFVKAVSVANKSGASVADISTLKGKVWLAMGDSYTHFLGASYTDGVTPSTSGKFGALASELGMTLYGYGISSSTIRYSTNNGSDGYSCQPMVRRVDTLISDHAEEADNVGLITFMGGINDPESKLGSLESTDEMTIYGGCHQIFYKLHNAFPNAKIVVILQPVAATASANEEFDYIQNTIYWTQYKQRAVKEVAEFYGLPICDCCFDWYTTANPVHLSTIWQSDKLHLTSLGEQRLTEKLVKVLEEIFV